MNDPDPSGIPGLEILPVVSWELSAQRKRIPPDLQRAIGAPTPFLRVSPAIDEKQRTKHHKYLEMYRRLSDVLDNWTSYAVQRSEPGDRLWRVFAWVRNEEDVQTLIMTVIGEDTNGSFNLILMHARKERFLARLRTEGRLADR